MGNEADVTLKVIRPTCPEEKAGLVGFPAGKMTVIEYSENPSRDWTLASTGLFSFSMEFVEKVKDQKLPLHLARKTFKGEAVLKQETFLFDQLLLAQTAHALLYPREEIFAPLKTPEDAPKVRASRCKSDVSQRAVAEAIGISQHHISEMGNGRLPIGKEMAYRLAGFFKTDYRLFL